MLRPSGPGRRLKLLHSGVVYASERDRRVFRRDCRHEVPLGTGRTAVTHRTARERQRCQYQQMIDERKIGDVVGLEPAIDYVSALEECSQSMAC